MKTMTEAARTQTLPACEVTPRGDLLVDLPGHGPRIIPASRYTDSTPTSCEIGLYELGGVPWVQVETVFYADGTHSAHLGNCRKIADLGAPAVRMPSWEHPPDGVSADEWRRGYALADPAPGDGAGWERGYAWRMQGTAEEARLARLAREE